MRMMAAVILTVVLMAAPGISVRADTAAASARAVQNDAAFQSWLQALLGRIQADPKYRRLPLDTAAQTSAFEVKLHEAYRGILSPAEFVAWADHAYPGHAYEIGVIRGALPH